MGAGGHQLLPVSQVSVITIVTSRLERHVYILRSCSGSVGSCPFTPSPTNELGAKQDVITPIWLRDQSQDWQVACLPRRGCPTRGHDLPLSTAGPTVTQTLGTDSRRYSSVSQLQFVLIIYRLQWGHIITVLAYQLMGRGRNVAHPRCTIGIIYHRERCQPINNCGSISFICKAFIMPCQPAS